MLGSRDVCMRGIARVVLPEQLEWRQKSQLIREMYDIVQAHAGSHLSGAWAGGTDDGGVGGAVPRLPLLAPRRLATLSALRRGAVC